MSAIKHVRLSNSLVFALLVASIPMDAARKRVPIAIGLGTNLIGPPDVVRDRLPWTARRRRAT